MYGYGLLSFPQKPLHYSNTGLSKWGAKKYEMIEVTLQALLFHSFVCIQVLQSGLQITYLPASFSNTLGLSTRDGDF